MALCWAGANRAGRSVVGTLPADVDLVDFVEARYRRRWRWLDVVDGDVQVGRICAHPDTGRRIWWAEQPLPGV